MHRRRKPGDGQQDPPSLICTDPGETGAVAGARRGGGPAGGPRVACLWPVGRGALWPACGLSVGVPVGGPARELVEWV